MYLGLGIRDDVIEAFQAENIGKGLDAHDFG
jgi:hypothetical protein